MQIKIWRLSESSLPLRAECRARDAGAGQLTSLRVQLAQHFADDLADALQRLQVILRLVVLLLGTRHRVAQLPHFRIHLLVLEQLGPEL